MAKKKRGFFKTISIAVGAAAAFAVLAVQLKRKNRKKSAADAPEQAPNPDVPEEPEGAAMDTNRDGTIDVSLTDDDAL